MTRRLPVLCTQNSIVVGAAIILPNSNSIIAIKWANLQWQLNLCYVTILVRFSVYLVGNSEWVQILSWELIKWINDWVVIGFHQISAAFYKRWRGYIYCKMVVLNLKVVPSHTCRLRVMLATLQVTWLFSRSSQKRRNSSFQYKWRYRIFSNIGPASISFS